MSGPERRPWYSAAQRAFVPRLQVKPGSLARAAAAGIHRRHQHEARGICDAMIGAGDRDLTDFQRLAQRIEHLRLEFGKLVEKQYAMMGERDFARPRAQAAADERRHARGMMRRAKRPPVGQRPTLDLACDRGDHRDLEKLRGCERRQDRRQPRGQHRFAGPGWADQ